jgi:septal ring factor EnvC (AmiA/AmiB activator)
VPEVPDAAALAANLRTIRTTENAAIAKQIAELDADLQRIEKDIAKAESNLNNLANGLYGLTTSEISTIQEHYTLLTAEPENPSG